MGVRQVYLMKIDMDYKPNGLFKRKEFMRLNFYFDETSETSHIIFEDKLNQKSSRYFDDFKLSEKFTELVTDMVDILNDVADMSDFIAIGKNLNCEYKKVI